MKTKPASPDSSKRLGHVHHKFRPEMTKPKNKTNERSTCAYDSASGFYLKCPVAVAEPTKAALQKPLSTGIKADPLTPPPPDLCTGHPVCSTPGLSVLSKSCKVLQNSWRGRRPFLWLACGSQVCWLDAELCKVQRELNSPLYIRKLLKSYTYN